MPSDVTSKAAQERAREIVEIWGFPSSDWKYGHPRLIESIVAAIREAREKPSHSWPTCQDHECVQHAPHWYALGYAPPNPPEAQAVVAAARALQERMDEIEPKCERVWSLYHIHGGGWPEDLNWKAERDALRAALDGMEGKK